MSDRLFRWRAIQMAEARSGASAPTYVAEFRWTPSPPVLERLGACHCIDIPFVFDLLDAPLVAHLFGPNPPQPLATWLHRTMVDFVKTRDPALPGYDVQHCRVTLIDREPCYADDPFSAELAFWSASAWARAQILTGPKSLASALSDSESTVKYLR